MRHVLILVLNLLLAVSSASAGGKEDKRLARCAAVLEDILKAKTVPKEFLDRAECVLIIPSVKTFSFIFGRSYGRGAMVCRTGKHFVGPWGAPAMYGLEKTNIGFQLGAHATDYVLLAMTPGAVESLLGSKVNLGAGAAVVAGSKGRRTGQAPRKVTGPVRDAKRVKYLRYTRSRGFFAGASLGGSTLREDSKANKKVYGRKISAREIVIDADVAVPQAGSRLVSLLQKVSPTQ
jgi:lipid-binding SYLF domain-containing protein